MLPIDNCRFPEGLGLLVRGQIGVMLRHILVGELVEHLWVLVVKSDPSVALDKVVLILALGLPITKYVAPLDGRQAPLAVVTVSALDIILEVFRWVHGRPVVLVLAHVQQVFGLSGARHNKASSTSPYPFIASCSISGIIQTQRTVAILLFDSSFKTIPTPITTKSLHGS